MTPPEGRPGHPRTDVAVVLAFFPYCFLFYLYARFITGDLVD